MPTLPATDKTEALELREQIKDLDTRLKFVESKGVVQLRVTL